MAVMSHLFQYRYVGFGTRFLHKDGLRPDRAVVSDHDLYENELILDVGNMCWGYQGEPRTIVDHHFTRPDQFPSASAAVLHLGPRIASRWSAARAEATPIWLVTHREPDFDAYCSMFLARSILNGDIPADWTRFGLSAEGWSRTQDAFDWFRPTLTGLSADERWPLLLAHYASLVDNCRPLSCPRNASLHSVLYAAVARGRDYQSTGAVEFFEACRDAIRSGLHPQFDAVLENDSRFAPERSMLAMENEKYQNDVRRARKSIAFVPEYKDTFETFFDVRRTTPLLDAQGKLRPEHLPAREDNYVQTDAIFLKDPTCLLFKEWARLDMDNSSLGQGFAFTAIAYSDQKTANEINRTDYYFSLDYERAGKRHLYYLWAELQHAETIAFDRDHVPRAGAAREDFSLRAGVTPGWFQDPWFDGANYRSTIIVTPFAGTHIAAPGDFADLSNDAIAELVRTNLEIAPFHDQVEITDYSLVDGSAKPVLDRLDLLLIAAGGAAKVSNSLRFVALPLSPLSGPLERPTAERLVAVLWRALHPEGIGDPEPETLRRHLVFERTWAGIWTRHGIALAFRPDAHANKREIGSAIAQLAKLVCQTQTLAASQQRDANDASESIEERLAESRARLVEALQFEQRLTYPSLYIVSCLFEVIQARRMLDALSHLTEVHSSLDQTKQLIRHTQTVANVQSNLEVFEVLLAAVYGGEFVHIFWEGKYAHEPHEWWIISGALVFGLIAALILKPWKRHKEN